MYCGEVGLFKSPVIGFFFFNFKCGSSHGVGQRHRAGSAQTRVIHFKSYIRELQSKKEKNWRLIEEYTYDNSPSIGTGVLFAKSRLSFLIFHINYEYLKTRLSFLLLYFCAHCITFSFVPYFQSIYTGAQNR